LVYYKIINMKNLFIIAAFASLMSCGHDHTPVIINSQSDTLTCCHTDSVIDSLQNVNELLDYLESIPSTHR
jgi:hypothetical protein